MVNTEIVSKDQIQNRIAWSGEVNGTVITAYDDPVNPKFLSADVMQNWGYTGSSCNWVLGKMISLEETITWLDDHKNRKTDEIREFIMNRVSIMKETASCLATKSESSTSVTSLLLFSNSEFKHVRTMMIDGEPWFVGKDIADILGYTNTAKAIRDHVDNEDKLTERIVLSGQNREMYIINESGLYSLIISSKLPSAKRFKHWVTSEVLPTIRKQNVYLTPDAQQKLVDAVTKSVTDSIMKQLNSKYSESKPVQNPSHKPELPKLQGPVESKFYGIKNMRSANQFHVADHPVSIGELALIAKENELYVSRNEIFATLRRMGILSKDRMSWNALISHKSWFIVVNHYNRSGGFSYSTLQVKPEYQGRVLYIAQTYRERKN